MKKLRVIVLMGGKSPEHEVSLVTGREVVRNFDKNRYEVIPLVISQNGQLPFSLLIKKRPDVVFIAMHGPFGEDGTIQGFLELAGLPYTGAKVLASTLGMNKIMFRKIMEREKIPVPDSIVFTRKDKKSTILEKFEFPLVVKPSDQGSSVGVSIVHNRNELNPALNRGFFYSKRLLVEEYLQGTEVACGVLGNENPRALPVVEIVPKKEFFDYEAKYQKGLSEEIVPARISDELTKEVQRLSVAVFKAIDCRGFARVDLIIAKGKPKVLEINTIPGLTPMSLFPKEAQAAGISYPQLLDRLIELALEK